MQLISGLQGPFKYTQLNTTIRSQVLAPELNIAVSIYFSTCIIIIKSIDAIFVTVILVH